MDDNERRSRAEMDKYHAFSHALLPTAQFNDGDGDGDGIRAVVIKPLPPGQCQVSETGGE